MANLAEECKCFIPRSPPQIVEGITLKFPAVLWRLVNSCGTGAIAWEGDGSSIRIDKIKFENEYLNKPTFFKTKNFQSFIRQLNIYGFRKLPSHNYHRGQDDSMLVYKHDCFCKGHPELLAGVVRNTAVRRTQREQAVRDVEAQLVSSKFLANIDLGLLTFGSIAMGKLSVDLV